MTFAKDSCIIRDAKSREKLVIISKTRNNMFPLDVSRVGQVNVVLNVKENSKM